jgi:hypothetical protein
MLHADVETITVNATSVARYVFFIVFPLYYYRYATAVPAAAIRVPDGFQRVTISIRGDVRL